MEVVRKPVLEIIAPSRNATVILILDSILPETTSDSGTTYKKLLFRDKAGTEISGTLFEADIELFSDEFHTGREYEITGAVITPIPEHVRRGSHAFQMIIKPTTKVVELAPESVGTHSYIVPLDSAIEYLEHQGRIDIVGIVVHVTSSRKVRPRYKNVEFDARDVVLVDGSMRPTKLTVWQAFVFAEAQLISDMIASHPIVLSTRVSASKFSSMSSKFILQKAVGIQLFFLLSDQTMMAPRQLFLDNGKRTTI